MDVPKLNIITTDISLNVSGDIPNNVTSEERKRVKKVKLITNPNTMPIGLFFPPLIPPDSTMGNIGRIHGERIVTNPAIKANKIRIIIEMTYCLLIQQHLHHSISSVRFPPSRRIRMCADT